MNGEGFLRIVNEAFKPFLKDLGFFMDEPLISGRFYCADFNSTSHQVSVSYEPGENTLFVMVGESREGKFSDIDDRTKTPRLSDLNSKYMSMITQAERRESEKILEFVMVHDKEERQLLKAAKELRLVLPKYLFEKQQ